MGKLGLQQFRNWIKMGKAKVIQKPGMYGGKYYPQLIVINKRTYKVLGKDMEIELVPAKSEDGVPLEEELRDMKASGRGSPHIPLGKIATGMYRRDSDRDEARPIVKQIVDLYESYVSGEEQKTGRDIKNAMKYTLFDRAAHNILKKINASRTAKTIAEDRAFERVFGELPKKKTFGRRKSGGPRFLKRVGYRWRAVGASRGRIIYVRIGGPRRLTRETKIVVHPSRRESVGLRGGKFRTRTRAIKLRKIGEILDDQLTNVDEALSLRTISGLEGRFGKMNKRTRAINTLGKLQSGGLDKQDIQKLMGVEDLGKIPGVDFTKGNPGNIKALIRWAGKVGFSDVYQKIKDKPWVKDPKRLAGWLKAQAKKRGVLSPAHPYVGRKKG